MVAAQAGDRDALWELCQMHGGFLWEQARRMHRYGVEIEDVVQHGMLRLIQAVKGFDPDRGRRLLSFCGKRILLEMRRFAASAALDAISLDHNPATGERIDVSDESIDPAEEAEQRERLRHLHQVLATLPCRELEVCLLAMKGDTYADIGRKLVLSRERVRQIHESAKSRIAAGLQRRGE